MCDRWVAVVNKRWSQESEVDDLLALDIGLEEVAADRAVAVGMVGILRQVLGRSGAQPRHVAQAPLRVEHHAVGRVAPVTPRVVGEELPERGQIERLRQLGRESLRANQAQFRQTAVPGQRLDAVKSHLRYRFALSMDNSESIAATVARYVALRRTPETINLVYQLYDRITPEDVQRIAGRYFVESGRTIVTLRPGEAQ